MICINFDIYNFIVHLIYMNKVCIVCVLLKNIPYLNKTHKIQTTINYMIKYRLHFTCSKKLIYIGAKEVLHFFVHIYSWLFVYIHKDPLGPHVINFFWFIWPMCLSYLYLVYTKSIVIFYLFFLKIDKRQDYVSICDLLFLYIPYVLPACGSVRLFKCPSFRPSISPFCLWFHVYLIHLLSWPSLFMVHQLFERPTDRPAAYILFIIISLLAFGSI